MKILMGFYYGIGDFISAIPAIKHLAKKNNVYILLGFNNSEILKIVDLKNITVIYFSLFSFFNIIQHLKLIHRLRKEKFEIIVISPHALDIHSSRKIPIFSLLVKAIGTQTIGPKTDKFSFLYNRRIAINKSLPLMKREIIYLKMANLISSTDRVSIKHIFNINKIKSTNKIVIHPGASRKIRMWSNVYYRCLVDLILKENPNFLIQFIGLKHQLDNIRDVFCEKKYSHTVKFYSGSLENSVLQILDSHSVITMDSGFSHIVSALGLNHFLIMGSADVQSVKPIYKNTKIIYQKILSCQPCNSYKCRYHDQLCLEIITPELVYKSLFPQKNKYIKVISV